MTKLNKKIIALIIMAVSMLLITPLVNAQEPDEVTVWTSKPNYAPGEKGTLYVAFYNNRDVAVTIKNITITYYAWRAYVGGTWVGNETHTMDVPLSGKGTKLLNEVVDITFTVPTDGRAINTTVQVKIGTDRGFEYGYANINVPETPSYMEQIVTLFTVQVVLIIVCTIIIAATIFLSARRPRVMWRREERAE